MAPAAQHSAALCALQVTGLFALFLLALLWNNQYMKASFLISEYDRTQGDVLPHGHKQHPCPPPVWHPCGTRVALETSAPVTRSLGHSASTGRAWRLGAAPQS